jgi:hypothetical protein
MLRERTAPAGSPETLVCAAIDLASFRARRRATDNDHGISAGVGLTVRDPAIADHAALLGLRPEGGPRRYQDHQRHGKCCHPLHESKLAVRTPGVNNPEFWARCPPLPLQTRSPRELTRSRQASRSRSWQSSRPRRQRAAGSGQCVLRPRTARPLGRPPHHRCDHARRPGRVLQIEPRLKVRAPGVARS